MSRVGVSTRQAHRISLLIEGRREVTVPVHGYGCQGKPRKDQEPRNLPSQRIELRPTMLHAYQGLILHVWTGPLSGLERGRTRMNAFRGLPNTMRFEVQIEDTDKEPEEALRARMSAAIMNEPREDQTRPSLPTRTAVNQPNSNQKRIHTSVSGYGELSYDGRAHRNGANDSNAQTSRKHHPFKVPRGSMSKRFECSTTTGGTTLTT
jgi:hypothetical protein